MHVGCNKGDDLVDQMYRWTLNAVFDIQKYQERLLFHGITSPRACPQQNHEKTYLPITENQRNVRGFCIEPMPNTYEAVSKSIVDLGLDSFIETYRLAVSSRPGVAQFPLHQTPGVESLGIDSASDSGYIKTSIVTIDQFASIHNLSLIHVLSIDTEGNDARVIIGSINALPFVKYLEFEYHNVYHWKHSDLQDTIDLLDVMGFTCYWAGNNGQLWKLTNCWDNSYHELKGWSNIACCNRFLGTLCHHMQILAT
jgi:FkbM family methyltransferase